MISIGLSLTGLSSSGSGAIAEVLAQMSAPTLVGGAGEATLTLAADPDGTVTRRDYQVTLAADTEFAAVIAEGSTTTAGDVILISPLGTGDYIARSRAVNGLAPGAWSVSSASATVSGAPRNVEPYTAGVTTATIPNSNRAFAIGAPIAGRRAVIMVTYERSAYTPLFLNNVELTQVRQQAQGNNRVRIYLTGVLDAAASTVNLRLSSSGTGKFRLSIIPLLNAEAASISTAGSGITASGQIIRVAEGYVPDRGLLFVAGTNGNGGLTPSLVGARFTVGAGPGGAHGYLAGGNRPGRREVGIRRAQGDLVAPVVACASVSSPDSIATAAHVAASVTPLRANGYTESVLMGVDQVRAVDLRQYLWGWYSGTGNAAVTFTLNSSPANSGASLSGSTLVLAPTGTVSGNVVVTAARVAPAESVTLTIPVSTGSVANAAAGRSYAYTPDVSQTVTVLPLGATVQNGASPPGRAGVGFYVPVLAGAAVRFAVRVAAPAGSPIRLQIKERGGRFDNSSAAAQAYAENAQDSFLRDYLIAAGATRVIETILNPVTDRLTVECGPLWARGGTPTTIWRRATAANTTFTLDRLSVTAAPGEAVPVGGNATVRTVREGEILYMLDKPRPVHRHLDGTLTVVSSALDPVNIITASPVTNVTTLTLTRHGAMLNVGVGVGSSGELSNGWDNRNGGDIGANPFSRARNVCPSADGALTFSGLVDGTEGCLQKVISVEDPDGVSVNKRRKHDAMSYLTVSLTTPPANSYSCPPVTLPKAFYSQADEIANILSIVPTFDAPATPGDFARLDWATRKRLLLSYIDVPGDARHLIAANSGPTYSDDFQIFETETLLRLLTNQFTDDQRRKLLRNIVQRGIDAAAQIEARTSWSANGGGSGVRKPFAAIAARVFDNDAALAAILDRGTAPVTWPEDLLALYTPASQVNVVQPDYSSTGRPRATHGPEHLGVPHMFFRVGGSGGGAGAFGSGPSANPDGAAYNAQMIRSSMGSWWAMRVIDGAAALLDSPAMLDVADRMFGWRESANWTVGGDSIPAVWRELYLAHRSGGEPVNAWRHGLDETGTQSGVGIGNVETATNVPVVRGFPLSIDLLNETNDWLGIAPLASGWSMSIDRVEVYNSGTKTFSTTTDVLDATLAGSIFEVAAGNSDVYRYIIAVTANSVTVEVPLIVHDANA